jgi:hypothetical protein
MSQLVEIARAPRPVGAPEADRVRAYLEERLRTLGLEVEPSTPTVVAHGAGDVVDVASVRNVVARLPGSASTGTVVLTGHYDSPPLSAGAGDDGVGVAAILEVLRVLSATEALRNDVVVLLADGSALGDLGARAFVEGHPAMSEAAFAVSVEMLGVSGPAWSLPVGSGQGASGEAGSRPFPDALSRPAATSAASTLPGSVTTPVSDLFAARGVPGYTLVGLRGREAHGGALDTAERVSEGTLAHQGGQLLELVRAAGTHDFRAGAPPGGGADVFTSVRGLGVVAWSGAWVLWTTVALWAVWLGLVFVLRLRGTDPRRLVGGVALGAASVATSFAIGRAVQQAVAAAHPEFGRLDGAIFHDGRLTVALLAAALGVTVFLYGLARLRFGRGELYAGALSVPLLLLGWATFTHPGAAAVLQIPLGMTVLCAAVVALFFSDHLGGPWAWIGTLIFCTAVLLFAVPGAEWLAAALTPRSSAVLTAVFAVGLLLLLPIGDWLLALRLWWTPLVAFAAAGGIIVSLLPSVQGSERHPEPTSLVLLVDDTVAVAAPAPVAADSTALAPESGPPAAGPTTDAMPAAGMRRIAGSWLTVPGAGETWARSWAVAGDTGPRGPGGLLLPRDDDWVVAGAGAAAELTPPTVELVEQGSAEGGWTARIAVRSGLGGEVVGLRIPDGVQGRIRSVDGAPLAGAGIDGPVRAVRRWGAAVDGPALFELHFTADGPVSLDVIEQHLRPQALLGDEFFVRNATVIPDASTGSDRVIQRSAVRLTPPPR